MSAPLLATIAGGVVEPVHYAGQGGDEASDDRFGAVGRYWLQGSSCALTAGHCATVYVNWRTGERRFDPDSSLLGYRRRRDLDHAGLRELSSVPVDITTFEVADHFVLENAGVRAHDPAALLVRAQGHRRRRLLSTCFPACTYVQIGGHLVTWSQGQEVHAFDLSTRKGSVWHATAYGPAAQGGGTPIVHTLTGVVYAVPAEPGGQDGSRIVTVPTRTR